MYSSLQSDYVSAQAEFAACCHIHKILTHVCMYVHAQINTFQQMFLKRKFTCCSHSVDKMTPYFCLPRVDTQIAAAFLKHICAVVGICGRAASTQKDI